MDFKTLRYYARSALELIWGVRNWPAMLALLLRKDHQGDYQVRLRRPRVRLDIRGAMDLWAVKETFLDAFYTKYGVPVENGWTVVDIGAGVGDFAILAGVAGANVRVYANEPFPESYQLLVRNLTLNAISNITAFQRAIWREAGTLALDLTGGEPLQIASREKGDGIDGTDETVEVEALTLGDLLEEQDLARIDLLKLDCEGAEYPILMSSPRDVLARVDRIVMEYHDLDEERNHFRLTAFLEAAGFRVNWRKNIVHDDIGYLFADR
ncbi:FkbM family methyltransferase [bacterium]|nr:FkbM family methyltransferase [bacterium]